MTLHGIINKILKPIAEDHLQINDFGFGDLDTYAASGAIKYPVMWVVFNNAPFAGNSLAYSLSIILADIAKEDGSDALKIQSDLIQVAADIAAVLQYSDNGEIEVTGDFVLNPFTQRFADFTAGVRMDITIKNIGSLNDCGTPFKSKIQ